MICAETKLSLGEAEEYPVVFSNTLTLLLLVFAVAGKVIFKFLGITMPAFQIAASIVLLVVALDMLRAQRSRVQETSEETTAGAEKADIAITPLAVPMLAGPGAISTANGIAITCSETAVALSQYHAHAVVTSYCEIEHAVAVEVACCDRPWTKAESVVLGQLESSCAIAWQHAQVVTKRVGYYDVFYAVAVEVAHC